jgi:hypothetical protein
MHAKAHRRKFPHFGAVIILSRDIDRYSYSEGRNRVTIRPRCGGIPSRSAALRQSDDTRVSEVL